VRPAFRLRTAGAAAGFLIVAAAARAVLPGDPSAVRGGAERAPASAGPHLSWNFETVSNPAVGLPITPHRIIRPLPPRGSRSADGTSFAALGASDRGEDAVTDPRAPHSFYFTRGIYSGGGWGRRRGSWSVDWPKSDLQFNVVLRRLTNIDAYPEQHALTLDDPDLRRFPFLYVLEVGYMYLTPPEIEGLRNYLLAGGFMVVDDFWGSYQQANFEDQMQRVFPEFPIVDLPLDHEIFRAFYDVKEILQVPAIDNYRYGGRTWEQDGYVPHVKAVFDNEGRLMVVINQNTDLGDAWEWAEQPDYPLKFSTYAFQMGVNFIIYAMSH
jgi:hypothetical protein